MDDRLVSLKWTLDAAGAGVAVVTEERSGKLQVERLVFDSLERLPRWITESVRDDGRSEGEIDLRSDRPTYIVRQMGDLWTVARRGCAPEDARFPNFRSASLRARQLAARSSPSYVIAVNEDESLRAVFQVT